MGALPLNRFRQVFASDTPPKASALDPARSTLTSPASDLPVKGVPTTPSGLSAASPPLEENPFSVPETQPSPRTGRGRRSSRLSRRKELPAVCDATIPETQPTVRTPTGAAARRIARGSRQKGFGAVAAISKGISKGGGSSGGRRSGLRSSARRRLSQQTSSIVDCDWLTETAELGSVRAGADDSAAATKVKDVDLEGQSEATSQPSISLRCERAAPSTSPDSKSVVRAITAGSKGDSPLLAAVAQAIATSVSTSPLLLSQGQAAGNADADVEYESARRERDDLPAIPLNQQTESSASNDNNFSSSPADDKVPPRVEAGTGIEGRCQEGGAGGSSPSLEQSLRDVSSSARQPSEPAGEPHTQNKCNRSHRDDKGEGEASPRGAELGPDAEMPVEVEVEVRGAGGGNSLGETGDEELVTPARPRRLANNFENNIDDIGEEDSIMERGEVRVVGEGGDVLALLLSC